MEDDIPKLKKMIAEYAERSCPQPPRPVVTADMILHGRDITYENAASLLRLQPFGEKNPEPVFALPGAVVSAVYPLSNGEHTKLTVRYDGREASVLLFRHKTSDLRYRTGSTVDLMVNMRAEEYNGSKRVSLIAIDHRFHGMKQDRFFAAADAYEAFSRGEDQNTAFLIRGLPEREEMVYIYNVIKAAGGEMLFEELCSTVEGNPKFNAFKLRVIVDAFCETGLAEFRLSVGRIKLLPPTKRADISEADTIKRLSALCKEGVH